MYVPVQFGMIWESSFGGLLYLRRSAVGEALYGTRWGRVCGICVYALIWLGNEVDRKVLRLFLAVFGLLCLLAVLACCTLPAAR